MPAPPSPSRWRAAGWRGASPARSSSCRTSPTWMTRSWRGRRSWACRRASTPRTGTASAASRWPGLASVRPTRRRARSQTSRASSASSRASSPTASPTPRPRATSTSTCPATTRTPRPRSPPAATAPRPTAPHPAAPPRPASPACGYGSLSNRDYREMAAGTRKEVEGDKRHPADFALWKAADAGDHPDGNWDSPWGRGRPGWHIECSLMATQALGDQVDVHGGGQDLIFPHHENEVAQSQAKTGKAPFVDVWMHAGFLNVEGEKLSKSLGNFITLKDALDDLEAQGHPAAVLRLYYVQTHYRSKIDYSRRGLQEAAASLRPLEQTRSLLAMASHTGGIGCADLDVPLAEAASRLSAAVEGAMDDDPHTPSA